MQKDTNHFDVLIIGRNCLDYISVVETFPAEDQKVPLAFRLVEGGGQGGTSACCVARLEGRVGLIGKVGGDEEGARCLDRLDAFGVDTRFVEVVEGGRTPVAYLYVTRKNGRRTIIYEPNQLPRIELTDEHLAMLSNAGTVLLDPETTYLAESVKKNADSRTRIIYDCERWKQGVAQMMELADYFIPSATFLESTPLMDGSLDFFQKVLKLKNDIKGQLVITRGEEGAFYPYDGNLYRVSPPEVNAVDTIGAGDNFHGAFALAVSLGFNLHRAVRFAVATATLSCRNYGGRQGLPDRRTALSMTEQIKAEVVCPSK
jgi:sulfofructose kinase